MNIAEEAEQYLRERDGRAAAIKWARGQLAWERWLAAIRQNNEKGAQ